MARAAAPAWDDFAGGRVDIISRDYGPSFELDHLGDGQDGLLSWLAKVSLTEDRDYWIQSLEPMLRDDA